MQGFSSGHMGKTEIKIFVFDVLYNTTSILFQKISVNNSMICENAHCRHFKGKAFHWPKVDPNLETEKMGNAENGQTP